MRRVLLKTTLAAAIAVTLHCSAGAQTLQGQLLSGTDILAKPGIRIAYPATATVDGNELTRTSMADITLKCNGEEYVNRVVDVTDILAEDGETVAQKVISVITDDEHYLAPGATVTLEMPEIKDGDNTNLDSEGNPETFTFRVKDYLTISSFANLDDYHYDNRGIIVKSGGQLTIDNSRAVTCEQLIVESEAGVVVREGSSLSITDTAYVFSSHSLNIDRGSKNGYIYNGGKVTAGSFVFSYYGNNTLNKGGHFLASPVSGKILECYTLDNMNISAIYRFNDYPLGVENRQYTKLNLANIKEEEAELGKSYQFTGTFFDKIFRVKGDKLWEVDQYTITGTIGSNATTTYYEICVPNAFPFPINMTNLKDNIYNLYGRDGNCTQTSTILKTGLNNRNTDFKTAQILGQGEVGLNCNLNSTNIEYEITIKKEYAELPTETGTSDSETTDIKYIRFELINPEVNTYGLEYSNIACVFYEPTEFFSETCNPEKEQANLIPGTSANIKSPLICANKNISLSIFSQKETYLQGKGYTELRPAVPESVTATLYLKVKDTNLPEGTKVYVEDHEDINLCETEYDVDITGNADWTSTWGVKYKSTKVKIYVETPEETEEPSDPTAIGNTAQAETVTIANTAGGISITNRTGEELLYSITDINGKIIRSGIANIGCNNVEVLGRNIIFAAVTTKSGKTIKNGKFITK